MSCLETHLKCYIPVFVFASWLVMVTFLHHTELQVPWYSDDKWDNVRGEFQNVFIFTVCNCSCGKVMFSQASISHSVHREGCLPWSDIPPGRHTPHRADTPLGRHPLHSACWDTVNKRAVSILLECILVLHSFGLQPLDVSDVPKPVIETPLLFCFKVYMIYFLTVFPLGTSFAIKIIRMHSSRMRTNRCSAHH